MDLLHKNYDIQIEDLTLKVRELNDSVVDKLKKLDQANKTSEDLKLEVVKLQTQNKKLITDLETLKQSNHVIQKELTKSSQKCVVFEKEKILMQEKFRLDMETLKKETATANLFVADSVSDQTRQVKLNLKKNHI